VAGWLQPQWGPAPSKVIIVVEVVEGVVAALLHDAIEVLKGHVACRLMEA
jgi:hypothetical protein